MNNTVYDLGLICSTKYKYRYFDPFIYLLGCAVNIYGLTLGNTYFHKVIESKKCALKHSTHGGV